MIRKSKETQQSAEKVAFMEIGKSAIAVFDSKSYDRDYLGRASAADKLDLRFHEFRLKPETAFAAAGWGDGVPHPESVRNAPLHGGASRYRPR